MQAPKIDRNGSLDKLNLDIKLPKIKKNISNFRNEAHKHLQSLEKNLKVNEELNKNINTFIKKVRNELSKDSHKGSIENLTNIAKTQKKQSQIM